MHTVETKYNSNTKCHQSISAIFVAIQPRPYGSSKSLEIQIKSNQDLLFFSLFKNSLKLLGIKAKLGKNEL